MLLILVHFNKQNAINIGALHEILNHDLLSCFQLFAKQKHLLQTRQVCIAWWGWLISRKVKCITIMVQTCSTPPTLQKTGLDTCFKISLNILRKYSERFIDMIWRCLIMIRGCTDIPPLASFLILCDFCKTLLFQNRIKSSIQVLIFVWILLEFK